MSEKPAKPAAKRTRTTTRTTARATTRKPKATLSQPDHDTIAERAYFIHLEGDNHDELGNWLRAERELMVA
ncbi:MAG TPA: hypothetical protein VMU39_24625 [Solirubrobacteraceae bacterium]|nr:hypothetical protein [Solirubrobacteraceae bacterium]